MNYRELIQTFTADDYELCRVNLHIHTNYSDGTAGFKDIVTVYSPQQHYEQLMALFDKVTNQIKK